MKEKIITSIVLGGVCIFGGYVVKKLQDIQKEIKYFERAKNVIYSRKEYDKLQRESK